MGKREKGRLKWEGSGWEKGEGLMLGKGGRVMHVKRRVKGGKMGEGIVWDLRDAKASLMQILGLLRSKS